MEYTDLHREHKVATDGSENRITNVLIRHWDVVRGDKNLPSQQDLDPNVLECVLDNCFLIETRELMLSGQHKYIYIGKNILDAYGSSITSPKDYHDVDPLSHKSKFKEVIAQGKPVTEEGEFVNKEGHVVKYRQCLIPLGKDGYTIDSIFGGMRFKVFK